MNFEQIKSDEQLQRLSQGNKNEADYYDELAAVFPQQRDSYEKSAELARQEAGEIDAEIKKRKQ